MAAFPCRRSAIVSVALLASQVLTAPPPCHAAAALGDRSAAISFRAGVNVEVDDDSDEAPDNFTTFDSAPEAAQSADDGASASASGTQNTSLVSNDGGFAAVITQATASTNQTTTEDDNGFADSGNDLEVEFEISGLPQPFSLSGTLGAEITGNPQENGASARIELRSQDALVFGLQIEDPGPEVDIDETGVLEPGLYTLTLTLEASADSDEDAGETGSSSATATWNIALYVDRCAEPQAIAGTDGSESLPGTPGADVICGRGGDDEIDGLGGDDVIFGGDGDDLIEGGDGDDTIRGEAGDDVICGDSLGPGSDPVISSAACGGPGSGDDEIHGGPGFDTIGGGAGNDRLFGGPGNSSQIDVIAGGLGDDTLAGDDSLEGGAVILMGGPGSDFLTGTPFCDQLCGEFFAFEQPGDSSGTRCVDDIPQHEEPLDDTIVDGGANRCTGGNSNLLRGGPGSDVILGSKGSDRIAGDEGDDQLEGGRKLDAIDGGEGSDKIRGQQGADVLMGGAGRDVIYGAKGADVMRGEDGRDVLRAADNRADSEINGGPGTDKAFIDAGLDPAPIGVETVVP